MSNEIVPVVDGEDKEELSIEDLKCDFLRAEVSQLACLVRLYRAVLCSSLEMSFGELRQQCQDGDQSQRPQALWWRALKFFLQLICLLAFYISIVWCCGPGRDTQMVQSIVSVGASTVQSIVALGESAIPASDVTAYKNRVRYNTFVFFMEYLYPMEQIPEQDTGCFDYHVLNFPGMMRQLLCSAQHCVATTYNSMLYNLGFGYQVETLPLVDGLWYDTMEFCRIIEVVEAEAVKQVDHEDDLFTSISLFYWLGMLLPS